jgi:site-specific DNA recombinase
MDMSRAAIYARQSLDRSGEGAAVDRQVADCQDLAARRGWTVVDVLIDNDVSASFGKVRPAYERLLEMVRAGAVDHIVVWHVDRLTRRLVDLEHVIDTCEATGVRLATVTGDLDLSTDTGRMLARILASVARGEVERKGARQRRANQQRAENGTGRWTRRPFGYDRVGDDVFVVEAEAAALRSAAADVLAGRSLGAIATEWNAAGIRTSTGGQWRTSPLRRALLNPRIAGRSMYNGADLGAGRWAPILTPELHGQVEARLLEPGRRTAFNTSAKHLLSGICECGVCGATMYGTPMKVGDRRWMAYRCPAYHVTRRMDLVDEVVNGTVIARLSLPDALALLTPDEDIDALRGDATDMRDRRDTLAALLAEGLLSPAAVRVQAAKLSKGIEAVEGRIAVALGDNPAAVVAGSDDVAEAWDGLPLVTRRSIIRTLMTVTVLSAGKGARFDPEQVRMDWKV